MKRLLCFTMSLVLILSLAACGGWKEPPVVIDEPETGAQDEVDIGVTAEELLLSNYGVEDLQSVTLGLLIQVTSDEYTGKVAGMFEQTDGEFHLILDEISPADANFPLYYNIYYDVAEETLYRIGVDGSWVKAVVPDYDMGFNRLSSIRAPNLVEGAVVADARDGYRVSGVSTNGVVADLVSFMFENNDIGNASVVFTYDKVSLMLRNMHWEVEQDGTSLIIDADVSNVNSTSITWPFDKEDVPFEDGEPVGDVVEDYIPGRLEGETLLCEAMFNTDYVGESEFLAGIPEQYRNLHEGVLYLTRWYFNSYSREGFVRMLSSSKPEIEEELTAAVLFCELANIPFENIWQGGFMSEGEVTNIRAVLIGIEG